ncbi:MAG: DUF2971 domain-containing protein [Spirochaetia bacterium]|nr:DUF2971 domain-containing protein [Spirochaetia bacterium]
MLAILNLIDPFEGQFNKILNNGQGSTLPRVIPFIVGQPNSYRDNLSAISNYGEEILICSLSSTGDNVVMWSLYADGHKGITIEFDIPDHLIAENGEYEYGKFYKIKYEPELKNVSSEKINKEIAFRIFTRKTKDWEYEQEYRLLYNEIFYQLDNKISRIILGNRISDKNEAIIRKLADNIEITKARYSTEGAKIVIDETAD